MHAHLGALFWDPRHAQAATLGAFAGDDLKRAGLHGVCVSRAPATCDGWRGVRAQGPSAGWQTAAARPSSSSSAAPAK